MSEHTPGPWKIGRWPCDWRVADDKHRIVTADGAEATIALVNGDKAWVKEHQANARLIAAAPKLLAALEMIAEQVFEVTPIGNTIIRLSPAQREQAREAIKEAKREA